MTQIVFTTAGTCHVAKVTKDGKNIVVDLVQDATWQTCEYNFTTEILEIFSIATDPSGHTYLYTVSTTVDPVVSIA